MTMYEIQLLFSISIRVIGAILSIILLMKIKDWRISFFTLMLMLMAFQQLLRLNAVKSEIPGFMVSILAVLVPFFVGRLLLQQKQDQSNLREMNEKLEQKVKERTSEMEQNIHKLKKALEEVNVLTGMLPICASCKKIRNDDGYWEQIEQYISDHSEAEFSHGMCPECAKRLYPEIYNEK